MDTKDKISDVNVRIAKVKDKLKPLFEEKKRLMVQRAKEIGCTCGVIIIDYDARRLVNVYCNAKHDPA